MFLYLILLDFIFYVCACVVQTIQPEKEKENFLIQCGKRKLDLCFNYNIHVVSYVIISNFSMKVTTYKYFSFN